MASVIQLLCMMSMAFGLHAAYPKSMSIKMVEEDQSAFASDADDLLSNKVARAIAEINIMSVSKELAYWVKILEAYKQLDVAELQRLQNEERPKNDLQIQIKTLLFITSAMEQQDLKSQKKSKKEEPILVLTPMANIKQSSFFKQITSSENSA